MHEPNESEGESERKAVETNLNLPSNQISTYIFYHYHPINAMKKAPMYCSSVQQRKNGKKRNKYYFALRTTHFAFIRLNGWYKNESSETMFYCDCVA